ncbi:putative mitochondrial chaperone protein DNAj [Leptomonas pyrrhocoris]|uniref:Putative mitochondrial chaperone protein DNAj n=1 Tax=Leptomonas pyrrhocoris TaxID=157538 RepID=A0A0N0E0V3_LEPPY|nr:putative mitochondrial chaperone protein DNAj [Leptomonas pyrrhocoris]XP_015665324.1 putative mitochondrial chaperone protein DNAj [Leptomonas pyrrhocoris]KPA86884.1 putative mitochondrial chaperone protein DNAj [Leptomonas pyrrhocoris]KPA86885.1 putative mitochondrial chaperone protein DNAj [Leptomonas pyrrhocoris]|eukprot:XP_015665323.1 putative mitochondrial chaperone protein DNAj [Leptomonas pyrrhocoris]
MWRTPAYRSVLGHLFLESVVQRGGSSAITRASATDVCATSKRAYVANGSTATSSSSPGPTRGAGNDYYNQSKEDEEDKVLEEEEFAALRDAAGDEFMPLTHRLAHKADALDADLRRLRYVLCDRPQFLADTVPATFSGRPTHMKRVLDLLRKDAAGDAEQRTSAASRGIKAAFSSSSLSANVESALRASAYISWTGTSAPVVRWLCLRLLWPRSKSGASAAHGTELVTVQGDLDYLRRVRALHQLNYYSRLNLTPKRHIGHALYQIMWNFVIAAQNACGCVVYGVLRGVKEHGMLKGICTGVLSGVVKGLAFLSYGWVLSPVLHLSRGLSNSFYGPLNALSGRYVFDATSGRWMRCTVADSCLFRHELQREKRVLRTIGRAEFRRKRMKAESKWANRMASMGFSVEMLAEKFMPGKKDCSGGGAEEKLRNPYDVLQVRRTASPQEIKKQYKKLAMVFHPDVAQGRLGRASSAEEKAAAQRNFEEISSAYQILSNPEKRKAYDMGGAQGVHLHETKYGKFMSRTPEEMVQSVFGGEGFRRMLVGELLRSHWALRYEAQVSVSLHELEELQSIRVRQLAMELAAMADVHARRPASPYYKGTAATAAGAGSSSSMPPPHRRSASLHGSASSSLPDYLKSGKAKVRGGGAAAGHRERHAVAAGAEGRGMEKEMHNSIMEELGAGREGASSSSAAPSFSGKKSNAAGAATSAEATPADPSVASPFRLRPGSNAYNCFSQDFEDRCDRFVRHMADACFGKQLLYEVGEAYVVNAQRFLGIRPFYSSKALVTRKVFSGMDRVFEAFKDKTKLDKQQVARKVVAEYFNMEYDSVVADIHLALRYALQMVLQDSVESEEVRRKRCYAVWMLGEKMMTVGEKWTSRLSKDEDLATYIQQAANSVATTSKPPAF